MMSQEAKGLLDKAFKVIKTSESSHSATTERYISLVNRRLHTFAGDEVWSIAGASLALKQAFETKFGVFRVRSEAVVDRSIGKEFGFITEPADRKALMDGGPKISEGYIVKGGVNLKPTSQRPSSPKGQGIRR